MVQTPPRPLATRGTAFVDGFGQERRLRGVCIGGWLNMENFITGYSANESLMRAKVTAAIGQDRADRFFDRFLEVFYADADAEFLADNGFDLVRIPINYHHLERDDRPFEIVEAGFRHLDRAIELGAKYGIYSIIDLHALPGSQNQHWHSDNATHIASFWQHRHFQERVLNIWRAIADRYKGNPWVAGYNLMNEPADETGSRVGPVYRELFDAVRAVDPDHIIFLDGNTYSTDFSMFDDQPWPNVVYSLHDYVEASLGRGGPYAGKTSASDKFLKRSEYARRTGTPILVGEFAPIYTNDESVDVVRRQILADQLDIYRDHDASWTSWMYKDLGRQGLVNAAPKSPYRQRFDGFVAKKERLGVDQWGSDGWGPRAVTMPVQELVDSEAPHFDPYPWGRFDWVRTMLLNLTLAQPLADEYAQLFCGLDDSELDALADSFAFENCQVRETLRRQLVEG
ncbi:glycoside hydrolase family 5 protein [Gryllotalpicola protaetiae]|uniref:Glycoside hydrolase family 5 protein n=1 Tax=Gryllotalpicola protaetiae TaxID=2419771 RepID=A0A387BT67_9MICO|nr:glycoside hydrolase family 5 protein [Gryllotalpicola protaetiae]AYG04137.1 glycoside hydrolase family 5 protein [Gryllotalpicola protaetiae]